MRTLLALLFALIATPALAQGWGHYDNDRFGYGLDIPPGFSSQNFSDNGDGESFAAGGKPTYLTVWGGNLTGSFEDEVSQRMAWGESEAWNTTSQTVTPRWANWSAIKGFRMLHQRMVLLCDGTSYAAFRLEYSVTDASAMDPAVERLAQSLRGNC